jgi:hypothetical protein
VYNTFKQGKKDVSCLLLDGLSLAGIFPFAITAWDAGREGQGKLVRLTHLISGT